MSSRAHNLDNCYVPQQEMQGVVRNVMCEILGEEFCLGIFLKVNVYENYSIVIN